MPKTNTTTTGVLPLPEVESAEQQQLQRQALHQEQLQADDVNGLLDNGGVDLPLPKTAADLAPAEAPARRQANGHDADLMEQLAAKRRKMAQDAENAPLVDDEHGDNVNSDVTGQDVPDESLGTPEAVGTQGVELPSQEVTRGFFTNAQGERFLRTVVDGQLVDLPESQVLSYVQKNESGDRKLREAAERKALLDEQERRLQQQTSTPQPSAQDVASVDVNELMQKRQEVYSRMFNGDESAIPELAAMDAEILAAVNRPVATPDINQILDQRERSKQVAQWTGQVEADELEFLNDPAFADVTGDDTRYKMVVQEAGRLTKELGAMEKGIRPLAIMQQAANNLRGFAPAPAPTVDSRTQRKQALGNTAATVGSSGTIQQRQAVPPAVPDGGSTPAAIRKRGFDELRKAKGKNA